MTAGALDSAGIRNAVDVCLEDFLAVKARTADTEVSRTLHGFLSAGGERIRPVLCVAGWHAGSGDQAPPPVLQVAASLEMFHAFALIHDDVMDNSATRRGKPCVHRALAALHQAERSRAAAECLGASAAILIGDAALTWADELVHTAGLTPAQLAAVLPLIDIMRSEAVYGQYLDITAAGRPTGDLGRATRIVRYKTAKYTAERLLHIGAALAGSPRSVRDALSGYALPLSEAFQLRDDPLSVFGTPARTGKSRLDDLREGKHTALVALALRHADPRQQDTLRALVGKPDLSEHEGDRLRHLFIDTGARDAVELMIEDRRAQALRSLETAAFAPAAAAALHHLAYTATKRPV
ncbi:polyprenyl synthetase family protein [Streptomyces sp. ET3-23]|uniref:polyprenyl synthetase family protein n=1 Tax=Streptomyces sp. ET3-23 TaxID=2885643 RepID=UPI001D102FB1|nr:polyprenyl synthetase family protein [Streptomyces sp. ET3-23]MCC2280705.1 polyprenyl synthetase family protein [Streptomyces sp. ET3-23]